jgi:uncharacterized membrane protein
MSGWLKARRADLVHSLGLVPAVMVVVFAALGIGLVELDGSLDLEGVRFVFAGDGSAARTVLSVIAGSLITVAGLTFSITMVALQLTSSQFSPRVLRTFFADRVTQVTIGTYVGTFVYALLVLRSVGTYGDSGFVPRVSVTFATLLGIAAVVLLIVFLQHVAQMIQVSHIMGAIAADTLGRLDALYPERFGEPAPDPVARADDGSPPGRVRAAQVGYVQRVALDDLARQLADEADRLTLRVCPGDFAGLETTLAEVWPAEAADRCCREIRDALPVRRERDLQEDIDFGLRQLADTALKALSPGINDPATAVTCIRYLGTILASLAERALPQAVREFPEHGLTVVLRRRGFEEHLTVLAQINRYAGGDGWVVCELLGALESIAAAAARGGAVRRTDAVARLARTVATQAQRETDAADDRAAIRRAAQAVAAAARPG